MQRHYKVFNITESVEYGMTRLTTPETKQGKKRWMDGWMDG